MTGRLHQMLEEIASSERLLSEKDNYCEQYYQETHERTADQSRS